MLNECILFSSFPPHISLHPFFGCFFFFLPALLVLYAAAYTAIEMPSSAFIVSKNIMTFFMWHSSRHRCKCTLLHQTVVRTTTQFNIHCCIKSSSPFFALFHSNACIGGVFTRLPIMHIAKWYRVH